MVEMQDLDIPHFSIKELKEKFEKNEIVINQEYQRSEIWKPYQKRNLIESIMKKFSIGVITIWENRQNKLEVLDGQQRIKTIMRFLNDEFLNNDENKFSELDTTRRSEIEGYSVYYLKLKTHLSDEQVSDIFTRLQEGAPLNISEKVNALRGKFKESFMEAFHNNAMFFSKVKNYRFRARFLSAQFLLLELESNFEKKLFPNMTYENFKKMNEKFKEEIPKKKVEAYNAYIRFLGTFMHDQIRAISPRDFLSLYLLVSYLHKRQANRSGLGIYLNKFTVRFMKNLTSFSIYDTLPPPGMNRKLFKKYMTYKQFGRKATPSESIERRFNIVLSEYRRIFPKIKFKDKIRLYNEEEKIRIYFKQDCKCFYCKRSLSFEKAECHHKKEYSEGGPTKISNAQLLHHQCHEAIHKHARS